MSDEIFDDPTVTEKRVQELAGLGFSCAQASKAMGCAPDFLGEIIKKYPHMRAAWDRGTTSALETAMRTVKHHVDNKNLTAALAFLRAKGEGWSEKATAGQAAAVTINFSPEVVQRLAEIYTTRREAGLIEQKEMRVVDASYDEVEIELQ